MIEFEVELQDLDNGSSEKTIKIPLNNGCGLSHQSEYVIVGSTPRIPGIQSMDIWELNDIVEEINCENPCMTADLLVVMMTAVDGELWDKEFVRRIKESDFIFEDLTDITWKMNKKELAACYIASEFKVPFEEGVTKKALEIITDDSILDYIDWELIWNQYAMNGFRLADGVGNNDQSLYLIHWR